ncbi:alpha/beta-hydrolase [Aspergillus ellipticus CBS 707.79]|uniref:Alpha/beta-hydrolase n=1 Tax=Aspergillus ellipticus CBS 707.79 TaxID=1448320 RepID=A0A319DRQ0_9EURO|nr:alpha/beta-hydrolase [Aspergillus ellipticus CBS 707.79]
MARAYAETDTIPTGWRTRQPGLTIWLLISVIRVLLVILFYTLYYVPPPFRQSRTWTYRQALTTRICKISFNVVRQIGFTQSLSLEPGKLGDSWMLMSPGPADSYRAPFTSETIIPETIGGTWYPGPPPKPSPPASTTTTTTTTISSPLLDSKTETQNLIILSFHGSSFLWLNGRPDDSGYTATLLNNAVSPTAHSLWVQYRLAGGNNPTPYPGPMQDALTAYLHLVNELNIPPSQIILAGDSSGATMAMALVRYLASFAHQTGHPLAELPPPRACLLFSPSVNYSYEGDAYALNTNRNQKTDYCDGEMGAWGAAAFAPPDVVRLDDPYLSPALHPFATPVPIFVQVGGAEVLCDSAREFVEAFRGVDGNVVEFLETPDVPHDVYMTGHILGWDREQKEMVEAAGRFVGGL